jgi:hypothetical protein
VSYFGPPCGTLSKWAMNIATVAKTTMIHRRRSNRDHIQELLQICLSCRTFAQLETTNERSALISSVSARSIHHPRQINRMNMAGPTPAPEEILTKRSKLQ